MGAFDDLLPAPSTGGAFDDLVPSAPPQTGVPASAPAANPFGDLVPQTSPEAARIVQGVSFEGDPNAGGQLRDLQARFGENDPPAIRVLGRVVIDPARYPEGLAAAESNGWLSRDQANAMATERPAIEKLASDRQRLLDAAGDNAELKARLYGFGRGAAGVGTGLATGAGLSAVLPAVGVTNPLVAGAIALGGSTLAGIGASEGYDALAEEVAKHNADVESFRASAQLEPGWAQSGELTALLIPTPGSLGRLARGAGIAATEGGAAGALRFAGGELAKGAAIGAGADAIVRGAATALGAHGMEISPESLGTAAGLGALLSGYNLRFRDYDTRQVGDILRRGIEWERAKTQVEDGGVIAPGAGEPLTPAEQQVFDQAIAQLGALREGGERIIPEGVGITSEQVVGSGNVATRTETRAEIGRDALPNFGDLIPPDTFAAGPSGPSQRSAAGPTSAEPAQASTSSMVPVVPGAETVVFGTKGSEVPARYAWVPTAQVQTSHSGEMLAANPAYKLTNTRDYQEPAERDKQLDVLQNFDPRRHVTDAPDAAVGPSIVGTVIDENGEASLQRFGGNSRGYAIANLPPEKRQALRELENAKAGQFGLQPANDPDAELVRYVGEFDFRQPGERERAQALVDTLNPSPGRVQGTAQRAALDAETVPAELLTSIGMDVAPADAQHFVETLIAQGHADRNLTSAIAAAPAQAQDYTQRLLVNAAFRQPMLAEIRSDPRAAGSTVRGLIDAAVPALVQTRALGGNGIADAITRAYANAIGYLDEKGTSLDSALERAAQQMEFDPESGVAREIAAALRKAIVTDSAGRPQPEPTAANAAALFETIRGAVAKYEPGADLFGESETLPEVVLRATRYWMERGGKGASDEAPTAAEKPVQTDTPTFKRWFGASKVVDAEGKPLRVFHATPHPFEEFKPGGNDEKLSGAAIWTTPNAEVQPAAHNTGAHIKEGTIHVKPGVRVLPLFAKIERPLIVDDTTRDFVHSVYGKSVPQLLPRQVVEKLKADGYDGVLYYPRGDSATLEEVIVFEPTQLKSAIANSGDFDPENPNILADQGGDRFGTPAEIFGSTEDVLEQAVNAAGATVLNADDMVARTPLMRGARSIAEGNAIHRELQPIAAKARDVALQELLARPVTRADAVVHLTAGGPGSGKSSMVARRGRAEVVLDTNLGNAEAAGRWIEKILASGRGVRIHFVSRPFLEAVQANLARATQAKRLSTADGIAKGHHDAQQTIRTLLQQHANTPRVSFHIRELAGGQWRDLTPAELLAQPVPPIDHYVRQAYALADELSQRPATGIDPEAVAVFRGDGLAADRPGGAAGGSADHGAAERGQRGSAPAGDQLRGAAAREGNPDQLERLPEGDSGLRIHASGGGDPYAPVKLAGLPGIRIVEMPEMVRLAQELGADLGLKRLRGGTRGFMMPLGGGIIRLDPRIFANQISAAKTMMHEIGHLIDWLPDRNLKRGNLWGRLYSLRKYMLEKFGSTLSTTTNKELREELIALTKYWKPYDPATVSEHYRKYRESAVELYADFISVLYNSPATAKQIAPKFFREFFRGIDTKPAVKAALVELQTWLHRPVTERLRDRAVRVDQMFAKAQEIFERKWLERQERFHGFRGWVSRFKQALFDHFAPIRDRADASGDRDAAAVIHQLFDSHPLASNEHWRWLERMQRKVVEPAESAGFTMDEIGRQLFYERIARENYEVSARMAATLGIDTGGRTVIANPQGHTPKTARDALLVQRTGNGIRRQTLLDLAVQEFHDQVFAVMEEAHAAGLFTDAQMRIIQENRENYATFTPLEYVDTYVPAGFFHQAGTLKEIQSPFVSTVLKVLQLQRAIQFQKLKVATVTFLQRHFAGEIEKAQTRNLPDGRGKVPVPPTQRGMQQIMVRERGRPAWYNVPKEIALMFERPDVPLMQSAMMLLDWPFREIFYPLFITYNPLFQLVRNPIRDARRTYVNAPPGVGMGAILRQLPILKQLGRNEALEAVRALVKRGEAEPLIAEMLAHLAVQPGEGTFVTSGGRIAPTTFDKLLAEHGLLPPEKQATAFRQLADKLGIGRVLEAIERAGRMNELLPKASVYKQLRVAGWQPRDAAYFVRNFIGTPNFTRRGTHVGLVNPALPFINIWLKGWAADIELARRGFQRTAGPEPGKSAASWWMRWAATSGVWTLLKVAGAVGLLGATIKRLFDGIGEYDKTNYDVVPVGFAGASEYNPQGKVAYFKVPKDPTDRVMSGLVFNSLRGVAVKAAKSGALGRELQQMNANADDRIAAAMARNVSVAANDVPGVNPVVKIAGAWSQFVQGWNPIDDYRGAHILSDAEHLAGGWHGVPPMLAWTWSESGLQGFVRYDPDANTTLEQTVAMAPLVNGLLRISDYGFREQQMSAERMEDGAAAAARLSLPANARQLNSEYSFLRNIGADDRTPDQEVRFQELRGWHEGVYKPAEQMLRDAGEMGLSEAAQDEVRRSAKEGSKPYEKR